MSRQDESDFSTFVVGCQRRLQRLAWLLTGNWASAEDLVQTALAKAWRHWDRVAAAYDAEAYVRRVLVNCFVSDRRRRWRAERPVPMVPEPPGRDTTAVVALQVSVHGALAALAPRQRAVIVLRYFADLTEAEVADLLGCRVGTVKSTTAKALQRLRQQPGLGGLLEEVQL